MVKESISKARLELLELRQGLQSDLEEREYVAHEHSRLSLVSAPVSDRFGQGAGYIYDPENLDTMLARYRHAWHELSDLTCFAI